MEEGRSIFFFFGSPFPFANDKNYKKWCRVIRDTNPPTNTKSELLAELDDHVVYFTHWRRS